MDHRRKRAGGSDRHSGPHVLPVLVVRRVAIAALVCVALVPIGIAGAMPASGTTPAVQDVAGTTQLNDVACPTASTCVAVGTGLVNGASEGVVVSISNGTPGSPQGVPGLSSLSSVACATATVCYAVGGSSVVPIASGAVGTPIPSSATLDAVACASSTACVAVGQQNASPFDPAGVPISGGIVGAPIGYSLADVGPLSVVACQNPSSCTAFGQNDSVLCLPHKACIDVDDIESVDIGSDASYVSAGGNGGIVSTGAVDDATCPTATSCYETGTLNNSSFVTDLPTSVVENTITNGAGAFGIACTSASTCIGVGAETVSGGFEGAVVGIDNGQPSAPTPIPGVFATTFSGRLQRVSCPTGTQCFAVGETTVNGSAEGVLVSLTPPTTSVTVPLGGATLSNTTTLDAAASDNVAVTQVGFLVSGANLNVPVVVGATPTIYGWLARWNTTTIPNGSYSLQSQATDTEGFTTTSAPITVTVDNPPPTTTVLVPTSGASTSGGTALLDAGASSNVAMVTFELTGGALSDHKIATANPTIYGWLAQWNTTTVPNGTYALQSVASYPNGVSTASAPITVIVNNPPPTTAVLIPSSGTTQSRGSSVLDASASANVSTISFELTGGTLSDDTIATATPTIYGWLAQWNTTTVPNGTYALQSVASYVNGVNTASVPITIMVSN